VSPGRYVTLLARRVLPLMSYVAPWSVTDDDGDRRTASKTLLALYTMCRRASKKFANVPRTENVEFAVDNLILGLGSRRYTHFSRPVPLVVALRASVRSYGCLDRAGLAFAGPYRRILASPFPHPEAATDRVRTSQPYRLSCCFSVHRT